MRLGTKQKCPGCGMIVSPTTHSCSKLDEDTAQ